MSDKSDSEQIDDIIAQQGGWKRDVLVALRAAIRAADPDAVLALARWIQQSAVSGR